MGKRLDTALNGFDKALNYIEKGKFANAEKEIMKFGYKPAINHSQYKAYRDFFDYKISFGNIPLSDKEVKSYILLYFIYGVRADSAIRDFEDRTHVALDADTMFKGFKIIRALDDLIMARKLSNGLDGSELKYVYRVESCKDERTCEYCKEMQSKEFDVRDAIIGVNYPPFNKCKCGHCRCFAAFNLK